MKYHNHLNYRDRKKTLLKLKLVFFVIGLIIVIGVGVFFYNYLKQQDNTTNSVSGSTTSVVAPSVNIFKSPHFQFQAPAQWVEVASESSATKFAYRGIRSSLIEHEMVIYVNQIPANLSANRALPVEYKNSKQELVANDVSEHCLKSLNNVQTIETPVVETSGVKIACDADSTNYKIMASQAQNGTVLKMQKPDGSEITYSIVYTNLTAIPNDVVLKSVLNTFQTR